jgi:hypothetical protein
VERDAPGCSSLVHQAAAAFARALKWRVPGIEDKLERLPDDLQVAVLESAIAKCFFNECLYDIFLQRAGARAKHAMLHVHKLKRPPPVCETSKPFLGHSMRRQW